MDDFLQVIGFGSAGWGLQLCLAMVMTIAVSAAAFAVGVLLGMVGAWGRLSGRPLARASATAYTSVFRGIPELLVIYLFFYGGSEALTGLGHLFGGSDFFGLNAFAVGSVAVGIVSGAYETEVLRGAYLAIPKGQIEAAKACGMPQIVILRRVIAPLALRYALPGMSNVWQLVVKESALISVTGLAELTRTISIGAGSTRLAFQFFIVGGALYLLIASVSGRLFLMAERRVNREIHIPVR